MDVMLFSKRLRRLLAGQETATLPDEMKEQIQNLHKEIKFMTSFARAHEYELNRLPLYDGEYELYLFHGREGHQIQNIIHKTRYFVLESEKAIDTFFLDMLQNKNESCSSKELCDALQDLEQTITRIKVKMEQLQPIESNNSSNHEYSCSSSIALERKNIREFIIKKKTCMVGREDEMEKVLDLLIEGQPSLSAVSIVGEVGVGKNTFAGEVYDNIYVKSYFDCRARVEYYGHCPDDVLDLVLKSLMPISGLSEIMGQNDQMKKTILGDYLRNKKYFIILVDVRHPDDCMAGLKNILPDNNNGSRILMTASTCYDMTLSYFFELECLNETQSWEILTDGDFGKEVSNLPDLETFKKTFDVCGGLPSFIVKFRSFLAEKDKQVAILRMTNYFQGKSRFDIDFRNNISVYSYKNLPDHLKPCLIYLLVFCLKRVIDTRQLYQLWIAEGFVEDNSEATAEKYLEEIVIRGFIKVTRRSSGGRIKTCRFSGSLGWDVEMLAHCTGLMNYKYSSQLNPLYETCTRLLTEYDFYSTYPHLRSLVFPTSINGDHAQSDGNYISENFKFLKLLEAGNLVLDQCPAGIDRLLLLRYLKLNIPSLKAFPSSLYNLVNLFTLDMPSSYIEEVPDDFWKMQKLRHLNFAFIRLPAYPRDSCGSLDYLNCLQDFLFSAV